MGDSLAFPLFFSIMKACEPKLNETSRWSKPIIRRHKTYVDYLKESTYTESFKTYWIQYYLSYIQEHNLFSNEEL